MNSPEAGVERSKEAALPSSRRMLRANEVADTLGISTRQLYRQIQAGSLPQPVHFGKRCARWPIEAIEKCLKLKAAESLRGLSGSR
jgi:predicted DNA-binding transcriptional regulator AlpA